MRFFFQAVIILFVIGVFSSCSNDFQITEKATDIPIVYGVLSAQDTATYIRVEKAFVDENTPAATLALDPNNLYFDDITVKLINPSGKSFDLNRVDGNLEGYQRKNGIFANAPNYLYKIKRSELNLFPRSEYRLVIAKNDGNIITESSTKVLTPLSDAKNEVNPPPLNSSLNFAYNSDFRVTWYPDDNAVIHDVELIFNYDETKNGVTEGKSISWKLATNFTDKFSSSGSYSVSTKGRSFYQFLASAIPPNSSTNEVIRVFKDISLIIISGGQPIKEYINIGLANIGITSSGEIPVYSNLSNDARGLFSSKTEYIRTGMILNKISLDSLSGGIYTKNLNFK